MKTMCSKLFLVGHEAGSQTEANRSVKEFPWALNTADASWIKLQFEWGTAVLVLVSKYFQKRSERHQKKTKTCSDLLNPLREKNITSHRFVLSRLERRKQDKTGHRYQKKTCPGPREIENLEEQRNVDTCFKHFQATFEECWELVSYR